MEMLLIQKDAFIQSERLRLEGVKDSLDQRVELENRASSLLTRLPPLEDVARKQCDDATMRLAKTPEESSFEIFRANEADQRAANALCQSLLAVRTQLQNAVRLGAPLCASATGFLSIEQANQNQFESAFNTHTGEITILLGLQQSQRNIQSVPALGYGPPPNDDSTPENFSPAQRAALSALTEFRSAKGQLENYQMGTNQCREIISEVNRTQRKWKETMKHLDAQEATEVIDHPGHTEAPRRPSLR